MKDVVALCRRVVIIAQGGIIYDGSLSGILDQFGGHKVISLQTAPGVAPPDLGRYGDVISIEGPRAKLRVDRNVVSEVLGAILSQHSFEDISVEDPPLEEVIARVFKSNSEVVEQGAATSR
jgi:ABC-2 type transport system ATP-binding protein